MGMGRGEAATPVCRQLLTRAANQAPWYGCVACGAEMGAADRKTSRMALLRARGRVSERFLRLGIHIACYRRETRQVRLGGVLRESASLEARFCPESTRMTSIRGADSAPVTLHLLSAPSAATDGLF